MSTLSRGFSRCSAGATALALATLAAGGVSAPAGHATAGRSGSLVPALPPPAPLFAGQDAAGFAASAAACRRAIASRSDFDKTSSSSPSD